MTALASAWRWYMDALEGMGRSVEAVPGWHHVERFLDEVADGLLFAVALLWAFRWWFGLMLVALIAAT